MASLMQQVAKCLTKPTRHQQIFAVIQNILSSQQRQIYVTKSTRKELCSDKSGEEFVNDHNKYTPISDLDSLKMRLELQIPTDQKAQNDYHTDFTNLVLMSKNDQEIDAAFKVIKENTEKLAELGLANQFSNKLGNLLYSLNKTDKFLEIFNVQETSLHFRTLTNLNLLMKLLINEKRHLEAIKLFAEFLILFKYEIIRLKPQIRMFAKSAYTLNSIESVQILERAIHMLSSNNKMNYKFKDSKTLFYICLLCVKQSKPGIAVKILDIVKKHSNNRTELEINLSIIVNSKAYRITKALKELQVLVELESHLFQEPLKYLKEAIEGTDTTEKDKSKYAEIISNLTSKKLISPLSLEESLETENPNNLKMVTNFNQSSVKQFRHKNSTITNRQKEYRYIFKEANHNYYTKNYNGVMTSFEKLLLNFENETNYVPLEALDFLSISIRNDKVGTLTQIKRIIELVKAKTKAKWPINSQIDLFLRLSELDPFYSLEFLAENDQVFQKKYPSVHKNIMAIGLCLIEQIDMALYQVEAILETSLNEGLEGLIFPKTLQVLKNVVMNSSENRHKNRLIEILMKMKRENRMTNFDINELNLSPIEKKNAFPGQN